MISSAVRCREYRQRWSRRRQGQAYDVVMCCGQSMEPRGPKLEPTCVRLGTRPLDLDTRNRSIKGR